MWPRILHQIALGWPLASHSWNFMHGNRQTIGHDPGAWDPQGLRATHRNRGCRRNLLLCNFAAPRRPTQEFKPAELEAERPRNIFLQNFRTAFALKRRPRWIGEAGARRLRDIR